MFGSLPCKRQSSRARLTGAAFVGLLSATALPLVGCDGGVSDKSDDERAEKRDDERRPSRDEGARDEGRGAAAPSASSRAPAGAASAAAPGGGAPLPPLPVREVPAGNVVGGAWLAKFKVGRTTDAAGLGWSAARGACVQQGMDLCTEPQWQRACEVDGAVGQVASWTTTARDGAGFVVRGGGGCAASTVVAGSSTAPDRIGLCCQRAVAIETTNPNPAFLLAVSTKLMAYERAVNAHSVGAVSALLDERLATFFTMKDVSRAEAEKKFDGAFRAHPTEAAIHGACRVSLELVGDPDKDKWVAECDKLIDRTSEVAVVLARYEFGGPDTKLRFIAEAKVLRGWAAP